MRYPRIIAFVLLVGGYLALADAAQARMDISLDETFPASVRADLNTVATEIRAVVSEIFAQAEPPLRLPIMCTVGTRPRTSLNNWSSPTQITIRLTVQGRYYAQFAFQLGHELAHVMIGLHRTNATVEALAEAVSLEALERLASKWKTHAPYPAWQSYAANFQEYRQQREADALRVSGLEPLWAREQALKAELRQRISRMNLVEDEINTDGSRAIFTVIAMVLRGQFALGWPRFVGIERCTMPPIPSENPQFRYSGFDQLCIKKQAPMLLWLMSEAQ